MADAFLIIRHPASCQASYDLIHLAAETLKLNVCVYGIQNNSPSAARAHMPWEGVTLIETGADRISVQHLLESIEARSPKAILVVHSVHIVAGIATGIEPYLTAHPSVNLVLHAESVRSSCAAANLKIIADLAKRSNVRAYAASHSTAKLFNGRFVPWSCHPHLIKRIDRDIARNKLSMPLDARVALVVGRADAAGILAANLIMASEDALKTVVIATSDMPSNVNDVCKSEMIENGKHSESAMANMFTMREIGSMTHEQFCCLASAIDVAVHANPCNEPTIAPVMLGMLGVPQAITSLAAMTEALAEVKSSITWVDAGLSIYSMDDMGGKVQLSTNTDLFEATTQLIGDLGPRTVAAARGADKLRASLGTPWAQWRDVFIWACDKLEPILEDVEEEATGQPESRSPEIVPVNERAHKLLEDMSTILEELLSLI